MREREREREREERERERERERGGVVMCMSISCFKKVFDFRIQVGSGQLTFESILQRSKNHRL